jgi:DNA replication and repair protein RecF
VWVSRLGLQAFRNHSDTVVELQPGVTIFVGDNGQGKTNVVEALGYLSNLSSHRVSSDDALVQFGHDSAEVTATVNHGSRSVDLSLTIRASGSNKGQVNRSSTPLNEVSAWVNVVFFSPEDLAIVRSDPTHRRRFIDQAVSMTTPRFASIFAEYDRVVKQRNMLLKSIRQHGHQSETASTLHVWNDKLVDLAADITMARWALLDSLEPLFSSSYDEIRPGHVVGMTLEHASVVLDEMGTSTPRDDVVEAYRHALATVGKKEQDRAMTLIGPHRDDVVVTLNELPSRTHSSQGEAWSTALALKLALARYHQMSSTSGDPIIILDDVFAELDTTRREALALAVAQWEQVIITAAVATDVPTGLAGRHLHVVKGTVSDG